MSKQGEAAPFEVRVVVGLAWHWNGGYHDLWQPQRLEEVAHKTTIAAAAQKLLRVMSHLDGIDFHPLERLMVQNDIDFSDASCSCLQGGLSCSLFTIFYG